MVNALLVASDTAVYIYELCQQLQSVKDVIQAAEYLLLLLDCDQSSTAAKHEAAPGMSSSQLHQSRRPLS